jgi:transposase-like protein
MNRENEKAMFAKIRRYNGYKPRKRSSLQLTGGSPQSMGIKQHNRRLADGANSFTKEKHFTRCELKYPLKNCKESRDHLYAKSIKHYYDKQQSEKGRINYNCVFCNANWVQRTKGSFQQRNPDDGQIVKDVPSNNLVRKEAEIRNIPIRHYEIGQEGD